MTHEQLIVMLISVTVSNASTLWETRVLLAAKVLPSPRYQINMYIVMKLDICRTSKTIHHAQQQNINIRASSKGSIPTIQSAKIYNFITWVALTYSGCSLQERYNEIGSLNSPHVDSDGSPCHAATNHNVGENCTIKEIWFLLRFKLFHLMRW